MKLNINRKNFLYNSMTGNIKTQILVIQKQIN